MTPARTTSPRTPGRHLAEIGVIGGSGLYALLDGARPVEVDTPFGRPSDPLVVGAVGGRRVAFVARHGTDHRFPPHRVPYRANLWALRSVGVRQVIAPCAVGSLRPDLGPGSLVVCDQLVDRTSGRCQTFWDGSAPDGGSDVAPGGAVHVPFADPYCPVGRASAVRLARDAGWPVTDGGTMVVVEGPRFSTRAESRWFAAQGWSVVNMTGHPEAVLARELALCYTPVALVTDLDAGVGPGSAVTQEEVFAVFARNTERLRSLLLDLVAALPLDRDCPCGRAVDGTAAAGRLP